MDMGNVFTQQGVSDIRSWLENLFGFEERPRYEPGYTVPVGGVTGISQYLPWVIIGGLVLILILRR